MLAVNLTGVFLRAREAAEVMLAQGHGGKLILTASIYGQVGSANGRSPAYMATKGGVVNLTRELAMEYARDGITGNAIAPGFFHTHIMAASGYTEEEIMARYERLQPRVPLRRLGQPADLQGTAIYLASAASDCVTGHVLTVDGAWVAS